MVYFIFLPVPIKTSGESSWIFSDKHQCLMDTVIVERLIVDLQNYHVLTRDQQENVSRLIQVSEKFYKRASIRKTDNIRIESNKTIILESGHQPNFLPHAGTWKKAFLLADVQKKLMTRGNSAVAFFGFPDQNLSTARLLSRDQIPALNKKGVEAIGFRIKDSDRLKAFCALCKNHHLNCGRQE